MPVGTGVTPALTSMTALQHSGRTVCSKTNSTTFHKVISSKIAHPAIDHEFAANCESRLIGSKEHHGIRDLRGFT